MKPLGANGATTASGSGPDDDMFKSYGGGSAASKVRKDLKIDQDSEDEYNLDTDINKFILDKYG